MSEQVEAARARLQNLKGRFPEISRRYGIGYSWLRKFASGERGARPSLTSMQKLISALNDIEGAAPATALTDDHAPPAQGPSEPAREGERGDEVEVESQDVGEDFADGWPGDGDA